MLTAVKNERRAGQLALRSPAEVTGLSVVAGRLTGPDNYTIGAEHVRLHFVDFITLAGPTDGLAAENRIEAPDGSMDYPDRMAGSSLDVLGANLTQPVWYSVDIPRTAPAGSYTGSVAIYSDQGEAELPVRLQVYDIALPDTNESEYRVDNWFSSAGWSTTWLAMNRQYGIEQWSPQWWALLGSIASYMKEHRNNVIWIDPVAYLQPGTTIGSSGRFKFDWTLFDRAVTIFEQAGAMKYLHGVSLMSKRGSDRFSVQMLNHSDGQTKIVYVPAQSAEAEAWLNQYLPALRRHLQEKGWQYRFYQSGGDEPASDRDQADNNWLYGKLHALAKGIKTIEALHLHSEAFTNTLDVFVVKQNVLEPNADYYRSRKLEGSGLWLYICNLPTDRYLTRNIDAPQGQVLLPHWYTFKNGLDGYLHWGFNYWNLPPHTICPQNVQPSSTLKEDGWNAANLVDGISSPVPSAKGWSSIGWPDGAHTESVTIDLGASRSVSRVMLYPYRASEMGQVCGFPADFTIRISADKKDWTQVAAETNYTVPDTPGFVPELSFASAEARYVKIEATRLGRNETGDYSMRFTEIALLNDDVLHYADSPYPGDSWLVYPDKDKLDVFSSIRSEIQLEGIQDHELLRLLAEAGKGADGLQIAQTLIAGGNDFNTDPAAIRLARESVLELLTGSCQPD